MKPFLLALPFLLVLALIVYARGSFHLFTVWNWLPVAVGYRVLILGLRWRGPDAAAAITFLAVAAFLPALFHLAWLFDWGDTGP